MKQEASFRESSSKLSSLLFKTASYKSHKVPTRRDKVGGEKVGRKITFSTNPVMRRFRSVLDPFYV